MRLEKIKLSGFKSFVDSTTIPFPSNLVGIVGPNGCGKSNVIDAVRWVMGESSAKHLRGDMMADVIFNGSNTRKPVGQAFVELVFDNADGALGGEYAAYQQISLKRQVNREGQSAYFLNGSRCRKKDITDLFLGTGLGSRSYAIIEQGTISRLIEAKPDELRVFLEEAAGISKYKERRRETENRIRRTRENLERIADLCDELEKQCRHLKRQAGIAERYKKFKAEERELRAQLLALCWKALDSSDSQQKIQLDVLQNKVEEVLASQRGFENKLESTRETCSQQRELWSAAQTAFYTHGSDITRAEQALQTRQMQLAQQQNELQRQQNIIASSNIILNEDKQKKIKSDCLMQEMEQALIGMQHSEQEKLQAVQLAEQDMTDWQKTWGDFTHQVAEPKRKIDVEKAKIHQLDSHLNQAAQRISKLVSEQQTAQQSVANDGLNDKQEMYQKLVDEQQAQQVKLTILQEKVVELRLLIQADNDSLAKARGEHSKFLGRLASIEMLEQSEEGKLNKSVQQWFQQNGLESSPVLAELLEVENGWEMAVETVLGSLLKATCVDGFSEILTKLGTLPEVDLTLVAVNMPTMELSAAPQTALVRRIKSKASGTSLFRNIHVAETLVEAEMLLVQLGDDQSVVTKDGVWLRHDFVSVKQGVAATGSVLARVKEKKKIVIEIALLVERISSFDGSLKLSRTNLTGVEQQANDCQRAITDSTRQASHLSVQLSDQRSKIEQANQRLLHIERDLIDLFDNQQKDTDLVQQSRQILSDASNAAELLEKQREQLQQQGSQKKQVLDVARNNIHALRNQMHSMQLKQESERSKAALVRKNSDTIVERITVSFGKIEELKLVLQQSSQPMDEQKLALQLMLGKKVSLESDLTKMRDQVEVSEQLIRQVENDRNATEKTTQQARESLSSAKIEHQEVLVRKQTLTEQLHENGVELAGVLVDLPSEANDRIWQQNVDELVLKIERLGAVNLTAIEEHKIQSERKRYLDEQQQDLNASLLILEQAVAKIDKESRTRFKDTFDKVNAGFEKRFPKLFGGGHAYLQQTGEDLLHTGVTVMARPPGKRNSSIHLLSGGEKALTAVALIFAIFDLNPAPFCMLDEVDAPLDEANVGRFSELVKEMSEHVQMILITHNKRTMEIANQLAGVTMKEAGVSRIVAVDLEEATEMVAS